MARSIEYFDPDGVTLNTSKSYAFGTKLAGTSASRKLWLRNNGDTALGAGFTQQLVDALLNGGVGIIKAALDTASVRPPYAGAAVQGAAGGLFGGGGAAPTGTWYFKVSRVNASGVSQPSPEFSYTITDASKKINLSWSIPAGPSDTAVRVYASQTSESYGATSKLGADLSAGATSVIWDGTALITGTPPTANTSAGAGPAYGTAPSLGTADMLLGALAVGEARALWFGYELPGAAGDESYLVNLHPVEV